MKLIERTFYLPEQYLTNIGLGLYIQIPEKGTIHEKAQKVFADFISLCNVERLNTGGINIEKVLDDYFSVFPPFENSEKKRKEFPDAFIAEEELGFLVLSNYNDALDNDLNGSPMAQTINVNKLK